MKLVIYKSRQIKQNSNRPIKSHDKDLLKNKNKKTKQNKKKNLITNYLMLNVVRKY